MRTKSLKKNKINVITLGCSKNVYDSEVLMGQLRASGKDVAHEAPEAEEGNIIVININIVIQIMQRTLYAFHINTYKGRHECLISKHHSSYIQAWLS